VSYIIEISTVDGTAVHSATVSAPSYEYPRTAPVLNYAVKYFWNVRAQRNGSDIGQRSAPAWFITPFVAASGGEPSLAEIEAALKQVLNDYPQFAEFRNLSLARIQEQGVILTPSQFMDLLGKYRIKSVNSK
jgi:hypothetical protein